MRTVAFSADYGLGSRKRTEDVGILGDFGIRVRPKIEEFGIFR